MYIHTYIYIYIYIYIYCFHKKFIYRDIASQKYWERFLRKSHVKLHLKTRKQKNLGENYNPPFLKNLLQNYRKFSRDKATKKRKPTKYKEKKGKMGKAKEMFPIQFPKNCKRKQNSKQSVQSHSDS